MATQTTTTTRALTGAIALLSPLLVPIHAHAASDADVAALRAQIAELDQKLRILERKNEIKEETAAADAKKAPKITASDGRIEIASADGGNSLRLRGLIQADARFYADGVNATNDTFLIRRARLIFEGKFSDIFQYVIQPEFNNAGTISLLDANVNALFAPGFQVRVGKFKTPVGLEQLQSDPVAFFNERSVVTGLTPNRDIGVQIHGDLFENRLSYAVGVFNGQPDGGSSTADDFDSDKTLAARLFATPFVNEPDSVLKGLGFGIAASQGNYDTTAGRATRYRTDGQQQFFGYEASTVADGQGFTWSPQAYFYYGSFGLIAEYVSSSIDVRRTAALPVQEVQNTGWNISAGYVLTGEDASYKGVVPKSVFNWEAGTWGAFEVVGRIAQLDIDDRVFAGGAAARLANPATSATEVTTYGVGLNWYPAKAVRVGLNYFYNDFQLAPGAAPAANAVISDNEQTLIARVQISF